MSTKSQNTRILNYLRKGGKITPLLALSRFGSLRLSGRIFDCKKMLDKKERIVTTMVQRGNKRFAQYSLVKRAA